MPLFKVESDGSKRIMVKAENLAELVNDAIKKLNLCPDTTYKIMLQQDMTEIDDDEILMDYVNQNKEVISLKIVDENYVQENNRNIINVTAEERAFSENDYEESCFSGSNSMEGELISKAPIINLKKGVFEKLSTEILDICEKGCKLTSLQRKALTNKIAEYIVETLKTNTRTKCKEIAGILCNKYKKTFRDSIGSSHEEWGDGIETLTLKIYNAVCYRKSKTAPIKSKRSESIDSDDAEEQERNRDTLLARRQDEYGCVEYSPMLPSTETALTQENKRLQLLKIHDSDCHEDKVLELIEATYPTLRAVINDKSRDLSIIFTDWPYLKHTNYFLHHCCKLLGKNVKKIWLDSLNTKAKTIRQYFKISNHMKKKTDNFINLLTEYKQAAEVTKNNFPKTFVIFRMLIEYFNEKESSLFKLVDVDIDGNEMLYTAETEYPILIVRGKSIYDEGVFCFVGINKNVQIHCNDPLDGILVTFLSYYVFGFVYPVEIEKTMEFIQRIFLKINPTSGAKRNAKEKRRRTMYDATVFNLANKLAEFSSEFSFNNIEHQKSAGKFH